MSTAICPTLAVSVLAKNGSLIFSSTSSSAVLAWSSFITLAARTYAYGIPTLASLRVYVQSCVSLHWHLSFMQDNMYTRLLILSCLVRVQLVRRDRTCTACVMATLQEPSYVGTYLRTLSLIHI